MASQLFIPNKAQVGYITQPGYGADMRTIETWANNVAGTVREITSNDHSVTVTNGSGPVTDLSASGGSGGYKSLTGPGETTTPGKLTQDGPFIVNDSGVTLTIDSGVSNTSLIDSVSSALDIECSAGYATLSGTVARLLSRTGDGNVQVSGGGSNIGGDYSNVGDTGHEIGFFNLGSATHQTVAGTLSAVTDPNAKAVLTSLITSLAAYALIGDGTT